MSSEISKNITKIIVISSDSMVLPTDVALKIHESSTDITIKETCFGTMVTGPKDSVDKVVDDVVALDKNHIFVKDRGFAPGDERRCRAVRGGGPRPGFHMLRQEVEMLPMIGRALDDYDRDVPLEETQRPKKLKLSKLKEIIESDSAK